MCAVDEAHGLRPTTVCVFAGARDVPSEAVRVPDRRSYSRRKRTQEQMSERRRRLDDLFRSYLYQYHRTVQYRQLEYCCLGLEMVYNCFYVHRQANRFPKADRYFGAHY